MIIHKAVEYGTLCQAAYRFGGHILTLDDKMVTCEACLELMDLKIRDGDLI